MSDPDPKTALEPVQPDKPEKGKAESPPVVEAEFVQPSPEPLVNARIIQILIEKEDIEHVERLLNAEVEYNRKRFEVIREHADKHPDRIDERKARKFRRTQYSVLLLALPFLLVLMTVTPLPIASILGIIAILIVAGVLLNARERDIDLRGFLKLVNMIIGGKKR